ncbi:hypothetical protein E2C01_101091 [Portunus trituberculatus]|uniref:Uncharacterized protein n=1 Tax=Portunus trituberculatus TaxID=210409 RepID=A0A5B7K4T5_PORTR|nr:hypothetical protein [Portunus trituberculatus]
MQGRQPCKGWRQLGEPTRGRRGRRRVFSLLASTSRSGEDSKAPQVGQEDEHTPGQPLYRRDSGLMNM